jgi:glycosyltransferase involved in cell wall biosynthesis
MKVLIFDVSSRLGAVGGAQRVAASLFYELKKRGIDTYYLGYETDYIKPSKDTLMLKRSRQKEIKSKLESYNMNKLLELRIVRAIYYTLYFLRGITLEEIKQWITQIKPDIVISNSINDYIVLKRLKPCMPDAKILYIEHANASGDYKSAFDYNIMALTFGTGLFVGLDRAKRRFFSFFDGVIAIKKEQYNAVKRYNSNVTIIHNSFLLSYKRPGQKELAALRAKLGIRDGEHIVLYLGRMAEAQKNVSTLIKAFKMVEDKDLHLLLVGEGKSLPMYMKLAEGDKRIIFTGRVSDADLPSYYGIADLYVLPSFWESFISLTAIEASTFGVPLLLSKQSINLDIMEQFGDRLFTFNSNNVQQLKELIERFFNDSRLRDKLKSLSSEIAKEYSKDRQIDTYAKVLKHFYSTGRLE